MKFAFHTFFYFLVDYIELVNCILFYSSKMFDYAYLQYNADVCYNCN